MRRYRRCKCKIYGYLYNLLATEVHFICLSVQNAPRESAKIEILNGVHFVSKWSRRCSGREEGRMLPLELQII